MFSDWGATPELLRVVNLANLRIEGGETRFAADIREQCIRRTGNAIEILQKSRPDELGQESKTIRSLVEAKDAFDETPIPEPASECCALI
jgi:hypothetical protein